MKKPVIVITETEYKKAKEIFDGASDIDVNPVSGGEEELAEKVEENSAFAAIVGVDKYSGPLYEALPEGGLIVRFGVGYDGIDFGKTAEKGIFVTNTPGALEESVAEQAVFLAGSLLRKITMLDAGMRCGKWEIIMGAELKGKTWLIVGLGAIGRRVSQIASFGFGAKVVACDIRDYDCTAMRKKFGVEDISPDYFKLAQEADIVSLHLSKNRETNLFINCRKISVLKPTAIIVNNARGSLVDENALYDALAGGTLAGAGLDVYRDEPYMPVHPDKDLRRLPNTILTPHNASSTAEACRRMAIRAIQNIRYALKQEFNKMDMVAGGKKI